MKLVGVKANSPRFHTLTYANNHSTLNPQPYMRKLIILLLLALVATGAEAKKKAAPAKKPAKKEVRTPAKPGLFGVQHWKDNYYFEVADSMLGRLFLATTRFVSTPAGCGKYGGEEANEHVLYWQRQGKQLLLRSHIYDTRVDSTDQIARAVAVSTEDPIVASLKVDSTYTDSVTHQRRYSVKVTDLFLGDNTVFSPYKGLKDMVGLSGFKKDLSYVERISTYPLNTEIVTVRTYGAGAKSRAPSAQMTGNMTVRLNTSLVLLPREPMEYRTFDPRVGYFTEAFTEFGDDQQRVERRQVITRWRLEPKDMEAYRRGELVEPVRPIVYYIDPATPKKWVPYLIAGVRDWNAAFEAAGFKNAIDARPWPADSTMSLEDARYSVIRYLASNIPNAYGPHVSDPRSGEILESHIGWYHNVMSLVHDWYQTQCGAVDSAARHAQFSDELMGQLIRFVSSHEVGHTLGLRHNMGASSATPTDSLRSARWLEKYGHTCSIMDYARFNYVAQPEDSIPRQLLFPRIGDYDRWAIEWGYSVLPQYEGERAKRLELNRRTIARLRESPRYWFGGEGIDNDPMAQTEDLGDDAMRASTYGVKNLRRIVERLPEWNYEEGDMDTRLKSAYVSAAQQLVRYAMHVTKNIGGMYHHYKSAEEPGAVYTPIPRATQRRALAWVSDNIFTEPTWLTRPSYVMRLIRVPENLTFGLVNSVIDKLTSAMTINLVAKHCQDADAYKPMEYITDLVDRVYASTATGAKTSLWTRHLQRRMVNNLAKAWRVTLIDDQRPYAYRALTLIRQRLQGAKATDADTRAHYQDLVHQIGLILEGKQQQSSGLTIKL